MNSTILVSGLTVGLGILLIANLATTRAVSRPILEWMKAPGTDRLDPWRCRLGILVLLFPAIAIILERVLPALGDRAFPGGGHELGSLGWFVENGVQWIATSVRESGWLGLLAYAVLRSPQAGVGKLTFVIIGYWLGGHFLLRVLLASSVPSESFDVLTFELGFYLIIGLIVSLIAGLFWLAARGTQARLLAPGEIHDSAGLGLRDILWIITGFAAMISGLQFLYSHPAQVSGVFEVRVETMLLLFLQAALTGMMMLVAAFLARNNRQRTASALIIVSLTVVDLIIPRHMMGIGDEASPGGLATNEPFPLLVLGRLVWLSGTFLGLSALRWLWHQMGWSVAMGKSAN